MLVSVGRAETPPTDAGAPVPKEGCTLAYTKIEELNAALAALDEAELSPRPDPALIEMLSRRALRAMQCAGVVGVVKEPDGRWTAIRSA